MPPKIILSVRDRNHRHLYDAPVNALRFSIGGSVDDDLPLADALLAPGQVALNTVGDSVWLEDHGAGSLVTVNGRSLTGARELRDRDVIGLAGAYELIVQWQPISREPASTRWHQSKAERRRPVFAAAISAGILIVIAVMAAFFWRPNQPPAGKETTPSPTMMDVPSPEVVSETGNLLAAVRQVLKCTSEDSGDYVFPDPVLQRAVGERVQRFRGDGEREHVAKALQAVGAHQLEIIEMARQTNLKKRPALLVYTVLAESLSDTADDPLEIARRMRQSLSDRRDRFSGENADYVLLAVATHKSGDWFGVWGRLKQLDSRNRNVWHLYQEKKWLDEGAYQFLLDFLALGAIAQEPARWGVEAAPLTPCGAETHRVG